MRIEWSTFQPFESRKDTVYAVRLVGHKYKDIARFKAALRTYQAVRLYDGSLIWKNAGGWLVEYHRWFVEPAVWADLLWFWEHIGMPVAEVPIDIASLRLEGGKYTYKANLKEFGDGDPVFSPSHYQERMKQR